MAPRVSIIIVNWNGCHHLRECLDSLHAQTYQEFEVVLVDNGSSDGSLPLLHQHYPWVKLVELGSNTGFATGNNIGLSHALGDYIVTLNNDTRAEADWLATLVNVADDNPQAGMVGCRICSFDEPDAIDSIGFGICRDGMSRGRFRQQRFSELALDPVVEVLLPSACVALYRREMLEEVGFFDEDFFAYAEDTDLGLRCRLAGWRAVVATNAVVYHKYSRTTGSFSAIKLYLVERNHYWVAVKNFPAAMLVLVPFYTVVRYLEQVRSVFSARGSGGEFRASAYRFLLIAALGKGMWDALIAMPRMLRKRRQVMDGKKISCGEMVFLLNQYRLSFRELLDQEQPR